MMEIFTGMCKGFFCFLHWALVASCEIFCCGAKTLQLQHLGSRACRLQWLWCTGTWTPDHTGSTAAAHELSSFTTCVFSVPGPGIEPTFPALQGGFLTTGQPRKSLYFLFRFISTYSAPSSINLLFCSHLANQNHLFLTLPPKIHFAVHIIMILLCHWLHHNVTIVEGNFCPER